MKKPSKREVERFLEYYDKRVESQMQELKRINKEIDRNVKKMLSL
jgi:hypothetical protein